MFGDDAAIAALLAANGLRCYEAPPEEEPPAPTDSVSVRRDLLVLDAALGGRPCWTTALRSREVDFVVLRADGWAASVSVILALHRTDEFTGQDAQASHAQASKTHMHDETGSGSCEKQPEQAVAIAIAEQRAMDSARRRLAKRFAHSIDRQQLAAIEQMINPPGPAARKWRQN